MKTGNAEKEKQGAWLDFAKLGASLTGKPAAGRKPRRLGVGATKTHVLARAGRAPPDRQRPEAAQRPFVAKRVNAMQHIDARTNISCCARERGWLT